MKVEILEFDGPNRTPAIPLLARAWLEMLKAGTCDETLIVDWDAQVIVATRADKPVGVICYSHQAHLKTLWVKVGYVVPEQRRRGIYRQMWQRLVAAAQRLKAVEIQGGTNIENKPMRACAGDLGREESYVVTRFKVPPAPKTPKPARK